MTRVKHVGGWLSVLTEAQSVGGVSAYRHGCVGVQLTMSRAQAAALRIELGKFLDDPAKRENGRWLRHHPERREAA